MNENMVNVLNSNAISINGNIVKDEKITINIKNNNSRNI